MNRISSLYIIICVALLALPSCSSERQGQKKAVTAKVQSAPYELLVVADKDWLKTAAGQQLVELVETPMEGLPQVEQNFRVTYINPEALKGTFRTYANILVADVDGKYGTAGMKQARNVYARPQQFLYLTAPNDGAFERLVAERGKQVLAVFNKNEFDRERALLAKTHSGAVVAQAQKQFGVNIWVPKDIDDLKTGKDFFWASASKQEFRLNVCLYSLPLQERTDYVEVRDSVMKLNIPGGRDDQWMETDRRTVSVDTLEGTNVVVVRGLWDMKNDAMGGPFVFYVYPDYQHHRVLIAEGFVFAPEEKKRPLVRQLEAALQTVELKGK